MMFSCVSAVAAVQLIMPGRKKKAKKPTARGQKDGEKDGHKRAAAASAGSASGSDCDDPEFRQQLEKLSRIQGKKITERNAPVRPPGHDLTSRHFVVTDAELSEWMKTDPVGKKVAQFAMTPACKAARFAQQGAPCADVSTIQILQSHGYFRHDGCFGQHVRNWLRAKKLVPLHDLDPLGIEILTKAQLRKVFKRMRFR